MSIFYANLIGWEAENVMISSIIMFQYVSYGFHDLILKMSSGTPNIIDLFGCQLDEPYGFPGDHQPDATML